MGAVDLITGVHEDDNPLTFPSTKWYKWFAWYPVKVHDKKVWMKTVYRHRSKIRIGPPGRVGSIYTAWVYGNIFDVLSK
jgi:hypothetical protein